MNDFKECDICNAKPGTPELCESCLQNRKVISELSQTISELSQTILKLTDENNWYVEKSEFMRQKYNDLQDSIQELVNFAGIDGRGGKDPCIYKRGNLWRYHTDRAKNQWHDHEDPATAALLARIKS